MFEFETHGDMDDMIKLEKELLLHLGFSDNDYPDNVIITKIKHNNLNLIVSYNSILSLQILTIF